MAGKNILIAIIALVVGAAIGYSVAQSQSKKLNDQITKLQASATEQADTLKSAQDEAAKAAAEAKAAADKASGLESQVADLKSKLDAQMAAAKDAGAKAMADMDALKSQVEAKAKEVMSQNEMIEQLKQQLQAATSSSQN